MGWVCCGFVGLLEVCFLFGCFMLICGFCGFDLFIALVGFGLVMLVWLVC